MSDINVQYLDHTIPCKVTHYLVKEPDPNDDCSDQDYQGYTEIEWRVVDKEVEEDLIVWLDKEDWERIEMMLVKEMESL